MGVLNTGNTMHARHTIVNRMIAKHNLSIKDYELSNIIRDEFGHKFDENAVMYLNALVTEFDAKIVISSTWRYAGLFEMKRMWEFRKLPETVIGITPCIGYPIEKETFGDEYRNTARGFEIKQFLRDIKKGAVPITHCDIRTPQQIESYVIFDDDSDVLNEQLNHFVKCSNEYGISYEEYLKACEILKT